MSLKANYFKLGLFVIGALVSGVILLIVIGSGRWFQPKLTIESYFNESVQGLDIGSKLKYRGVAIGEVTRIGFTYNKYQQEIPSLQRYRYVLVEAQIEPGSSAAASPPATSPSPRARRSRSRRGCASASRRRGSPARAISRSTTSNRRRRSFRSTGSPTTRTSRAHRRRSPRC